jgi:hypothetical protein
MRWIKVRVPVPIPTDAQPGVPTKPELINEYSETIRLNSSTSTLQTITFRSGFNGTLESVIVFTDKIDAGDYWMLTLRGAKIREKAYPVANTGIAETNARPIEAGDRLVLYYYSQGTTVKNIDLTPRIRYRGEGLS